MGLRAIAEADLATTLEDDIFGFGWPINITSPSGVSEAFIASSSDIALAVDADTGQVVSGRQAHCTVRLSSLYAAGFSIPSGISDTTVRPWIVTFNDINSLPYTFSVVQSNPDRALGVVVLLLESYQL